MIIYCDETAHLQNDNIGTMVLGALFIRDEYKRNIFSDIRKIKEKHGLSPYFELKWTKVSNGKLNLYLDVIDYVFSNRYTAFRGLVARKDIIDLSHHEDDYDLWYYKMYYYLLRDIIIYDTTNNIYLDIKDTNGGPRIRKLKEVLANEMKDFNFERITKIQQIHSHESEVLQVADLIIGAINYKQRGLTSSEAKLKVVSHLEQISNSSLLSSTKKNQIPFDLFCLEYGGLNGK